MSTIKTLQDVLGSERIDSRDLVDLQVDAEAEEAEQIENIIGELESYAGDNARDGIFLVREDKWEEYAEELAEDIGSIDRDASWPNNHIDWKAAAEELSIDYTTIEIDNTTYYYR